jgi:hypothetical protein
MAAGSGSTSGGLADSLFRAGRAAGVTTPRLRGRTAGRGVSGESGRVGRGGLGALARHPVPPVGHHVACHAPEDAYPELRNDRAMAGRHQVRASAVKPLATELGLRPSPRAQIVADIKHGLVTSSTSSSRTSAPWSTPSSSTPSRSRTSAPLGGSCVAVGLDRAPAPAWPGPVATAERDAGAGAASLHRRTPRRPVDG